MSLTIQLQTMLSMLAMGAWIGASLDTYGKLTYQPRSFRWTVAIRDLLFWCVQALLVFYVLYQANLGELRGYIFVALLCGYAAYRALLQSVYTYLLDRLIMLVVSIVRFIRKSVYYILINPVKWLLKLTLSLCMIVLTLVWKICLVISSIIWKPLWWLFRPLFQSLSKSKIYGKMVPYFRKLKEKSQSVWKKNDKR
ncbi:spore cortex biosynthesis protein YabQ [Alkalicoccobacillus porphyridii]|uniref:Spore cortex biosynthesis protein YabQ n=1 Tax=Alkalicoccobacillus porphyridii TaxID=2597270 RepID=A0A553ZU84_9BACI|nr:spore cortex biosynthesis protein YabQ [Alkalicoccobacillus porphyridii]TSB45037.1 spore cortex biosynthesis protein YabQ [Alkalicoccobacillus porphyridii]